MKTIFTLIAILLLVSCNKEERKIYATWIIEQSFSREHDNVHNQNGEHIWKRTLIRK